MQWIKKRSQLQEYYPFSRMPGIPEAFAEYLKNNPNKKRIPAIDKRKMVGWLSDANVKPTCQKDYSKRNYAQKTYIWDENRQQLLAKARNEREGDRIVITVEEILRTVEEVHIKDHAGWDATWSRVSKKYCGIVRADVIWLITKCGMCKVDPRKKSKGNHESQAPAAAPPVLPPPITLPEDGPEYQNNDDTTFQVQNYQNVFQDVTVDAYQNPYLGVYPDSYQDIFQDGFADICPDIYPETYPDVCPDIYPEIGPEAYQDVYQNGFQGAFQQEYQDGGWQGDLMNIDPSLLMLDQSLYANYSQGESSGTNNYTYGDNESGR